MSLLKRKQALEKFKYLKENEIKPYYRKNDIEFHLPISNEEEQDISKKILAIINMTDKNLALKAYYELLTSYGEENVSHVFKHVKLKDTKESIKNSRAFDKFEELLRSKWAIPFIVIIGLDKRYATTPSDYRREIAIYSKDYMLFDRKNDSIKDYMRILYECGGLREIYSRINQAIIYDMEDVLEKYVSFIMDHNCYHWLFEEYPSLKKHMQERDDAPTKTYVKKRTK